MDTSQLHNLPTNQKIALVFQLWDEIASSGVPIEVSDSVIAEVEQRCRELDADPSMAVDEEEMWRRVNEQ